MTAVVGCSLLVRSECVMREAPAMLVSVGRVRDKPKTIPLFSQQKFSHLQKGTSSGFATAWLLFK
jgi:hypothetical protein